MDERTKLRREKTQDEIETDRILKEKDEEIKEMHKMLEQMQQKLHHEQKRASSAYK